MSTDRQKILIVDDKAANLFSLEQVLKKTKAEIIRAQSGNDALVASLNHDFALAFLDVQMPVMDGYELAEWLRSEDKTRELPIIFVSAAYSSDYHVFKGYNAGAVDFMVKPYNPEILLSKVNVFLQLDRQKALLRKSRKNLARANKTLEEKVRERTRELETAIDNLTVEVRKRKQAETHIRKAKKEWQEIFEAIGQMTLILDRDHTIIRANRAVLEHTGLTTKEIVGKKCYSIFHGSDQAADHCPLKGLMDSDDSGLTESEIEISGKSFLVSCTPVFGSKGKLEKIIHIATDVTKQKQLKKELIQAHKMEAIGSLAGGIAHDFNNILAGVLGFTDLALEDAEKGSNIEADLKQVYSAGLRAKDLVKQILNFARTSDENFSPVRTDLIVKEVAKFLRSTIPTTIEIKNHINSGSLVLANPIKIHQLVMNLCSNAAHAIKDTGVIDISLTDVILEPADVSSDTAMKPGPYQKLTVSDTGIGIPPDIIDSIFQPFFTTKDINEGTGMGLAMVHTIVKECKGDVSVESRAGKGTVFTIVLPVTTDSKEKLPLPGKKHPHAGTEKILLVDDERAICKLASRMLKDVGYKVSIETDSESALALFSEQPDNFDLVITDMTMPKMAGDVLTQKILSIRPDMPVIIATGYSRRMIDSKVTDLGARAILNKPFEKNNLLKTVRKILDKKK